MTEPARAIQPGAADTDKMRIYFGGPETAASSPPGDVGNPMRQCSFTTAILVASTIDAQMALRHQRRDHVVGEDAGNMPGRGDMLQGQIQEIAEHRYSARPSVRIFGRTTRSGRGVKMALTVVAGRRKPAAFPALARPADTRARNFHFFGRGHQ